MSNQVRPTHPVMVNGLVKPGHVILAEMTPEKMHLLHMGSKLCSEAGELMDAIGKWCYYNQPLDHNNVREELGDIEFYLEGFRQGIGLIRHDCLEANIDKLMIRYPNFNYSDIAAQRRADKQ